MLYLSSNSGAQEVKKHPFYQTLHWDELIMHKAEFVPYLDSEEDTSYFDCKFCDINHVHVFLLCYQIFAGTNELYFCNPIEDTSPNHLFSQLERKCTTIRSPRIVCLV